jgi:predicted SAM-dependent methyltransferase
MEVRRLNWGCGRSPAPGWLNSDRNRGKGIDIAVDIRDGLPIATDSLDYVFSMHALQEVPLLDLVPVLRELHRVLMPGGALRLCLPDAEKGIRAYIQKDRDYFQVPDQDARSLGGKFVTHMLWYGHSRVLFTPDFIEELLEEAGFARVAHVAYRETASAHPEIVELDDRPRESLFVEAFKA